VAESNAYKIPVLCKAILSHAMAFSSHAELQSNKPAREMSTAELIEQVRRYIPAVEE